MSHSCVRFVMPDGTSRQLVLEKGASVSTVEQHVSRAFGVGQHVKIHCDQERMMRFPIEAENVRVTPLMAPRLLCENLSTINSTPLGPLLRLVPTLSLERRILDAFRSRLQCVRQLLTIGVDLEGGTASVGSRPVASVERDEESEDPVFDRIGLRMLAAFDARRVVPVLIVTCRPSSVHLFANPLPWSDGVACCGLCGASVCACSRLN